MPSRAPEPSRSASAVRILSVPLSTPIICRHLGPLLGTLLHWHKGRSVPCQGTDRCPGPIHKDRPVWAAYGAVEGWNDQEGLWVPAVLEMTAHGEEFTRGRALRGETWCWSREGEGGRRAPVIGVFCERTEEQLLRPCFDVPAILGRFFHPWKIVLGTANPTPPRVVLEALPGPAPQLPAELQPAPAEQAGPERLGRIKELIEQREREKRRAERAGPERNGQH